MYLPVQRYITKTLAVFYNLCKQNYNVANGTLLTDTSLIWRVINILFILYNYCSLCFFCLHSVSARNKIRVKRKYNLYRPSTRSRLLDIGQVLFYMFMDGDRVEVHKHAKRNEANIQPC